MRLAAMARSPLRCSASLRCLSPFHRPPLRRKDRIVTRSINDIMMEDEKTSSQKLVENTMAFLREDLKHLFDDQGIDTSRYHRSLPGLCNVVVYSYDDVVDFQDPVTSYSSLQGYLFNLGLLKNLLAPTFILHDMRQTGEHEITTRWTMQMSFAPANRTPLKSLWNPQLTFTGDIWRMSKNVR